MQFYLIDHRLLTLQSLEMLHTASRESRRRIESAARNIQVGDSNVLGIALLLKLQKGAYI